MFTVLPRFVSPARLPTVISTLSFSLMMLFKISLTFVERLSGPIKLLYFENIVFSTTMLAWIHDFFCFLSQALLGGYEGSYYNSNDKLDFNWFCQFPFYFIINEFYFYVLKLCLMKATFGKCNKAGYNYDKYQKINKTSATIWPVFPYTQRLLLHIYILLFSQAWSQSSLKSKSSVCGMVLVCLLLTA